MQSHVKDIARGISSSHPDKQKYVGLAEEFRMPYWDWASLKTDIVPQIALDSNYQVNGPKSSESVVDKGIILDYNPLFAFRFPKGTPKDITVSTPDLIYTLVILVHIDRFLSTI